MEIKKVTPEMRLRLRAPLPADAVKQNPSKTFLSTIKPIYVTERLNEVFGIGAWQVRTELIAPVASEHKKTSKREYNEFTALMKTSITIPEYGIYYECIAGSSNEDEGDSTKGGTTDGITKIASWLEIGINVFKGLGNVASEPSIEEGLAAILSASSREELETSYKRFSILKPVTSFMNAVKAMSALYPKEEVKAPIDIGTVPETQPIKWATDKQKDLIRSLINSHHIPEDYRQSITDIESTYEGELPLTEFERVFHELTDMIGKGAELEKTTPATEDQIAFIEITLDNAAFTEKERAKGYDSLKKGYTIAKARSVIKSLAMELDKRKVVSHAS